VRPSCCCREGSRKGTGARQALQRLGVSFHDVLAIGDAENDLDLFAACGFAACPASAVPEVMHAADWVFPGEAGAAAAEAITGPILGATLSAPRSQRERISFGWSRASGEPITIAAHGVNVLVQGDSQSGKSWLAGGLVERLVGREYATCVIDPEGDYQGLCDVPGVEWREVQQIADWEAALEVFEHDTAASVVVDLSSAPPDRKLALLRHGFGVIHGLRVSRGVPHWVVLDEAHYALHGQGVPDDVASIADKGFCLVTYRPSWMRAAVLDAMDVLILGRTTLPDELRSLRPMLERSGRGAAVIDALPGPCRPRFLSPRPSRRGGEQLRGTAAGEPSRAASG
jgi:hypothetical protein